jgi:putative transposase
LTLSERTFRCECGFQCDRDVNAARNLEHMAANCAVSARGDGSPTRRRKLTLSSLSVKREAGRAGALISQPNDAHLSNQGEKE